MVSKKRSGFRGNSVPGPKSSTPTGQRPKKKKLISRPTSASPKSFAGLPLPSVMRALNQLSQKLGAPWFLFGAQAAMLWGRPRTTDDVDATFAIDIDRIDFLVAEARDVGLILRPEGSVRLAREMRAVLLVHERANVPVDLILGASGLEDQFFKRVQMVRVGNLEKARSSRCSNA